MALCNHTEVDKQNWGRSMDEIYDHWISHKSIVNRFTYNNKYNLRSSIDNMEYFIKERMEMPFHPDLIMTDTQIKRVKIEMNEFAEALNGKFSNFAFMVPEGISKQDPVARRFYNNLNRILDFERVQVNKVAGANGQIADFMLEGYINQHKLSKTEGKFLGDKAIKELVSLRKQMNQTDVSDATQAKFIKKLEDFIESNEGVTIKQFHELIHMNAKEFANAKKPNYKREGKLITYDTSVYRAVERARNNLDEIGQVYIQGLSSMKELVALKYTNTRNIKDAKSISGAASRFIDTIDASIKNIKKGMAKGGYFPQVEFGNLMLLKENLNKAVESNSFNRDANFSNVVDNILAKVNVESIPHHAQGRNDLLSKHWERDPLLILKEYGDQAVQFNKTTRVQIEYLDALKHMPKSDTRFMKGMKRFIDEEYAVFTRGTKNRQEWANKAVLTMNAFQTARTMGLNITGAVKNAASAVNYYSRVGLGAVRDMRKAMAQETFLNNKGEVERFEDVVYRVEQESGFKFTDPARELYTEGLISRKDLESGNVSYNPVTGKITMENKPMQDFLKGKGGWVLEKALVFHRMTENQQRVWMFRTAFHQKYNQLVTQGASRSQAENFAKNFALKMVNGWAYEYAAHAKSKAVRGEWRTVEEMENGVIEKRLESALGAGSEVAFHLLHYPLSLVESQWSVLKGARKSLLAGQGFSESADLQHVMRYSGMMGFVGLASAMLNIDFTNIIENETLERVTRITDDLTQYDNPDKGTFGLLSEFSGPTIGMLKYGAIAGGVIDLEYHDLMKIIFGNVDYASPEDRRAEMYNAYQFSTFWGTTKNKIAPAIRDGRGRDLVTHYLKWYPSPWTKKGHQALMEAGLDKIVGKKPKKKSKQLTDAERALAVLDMLERNR